MMSEIQLREQLVNLLKGNVSLDDFEDWFVGESWNIHKGEDLGAQRLAYALELRLAEHDHGHLPEDELRRELQQLLNSPVLVFFGESAPVQTGSSMRINLQDQPLVFRPVDIRPAMASESQAPH